MPETQKGTTINTDEWGAYRHLSAAEHQHVTVCHAPGKRVWPRDEDGDGIREVHTNTIEGVWTGVRNFLRPFAGLTSSTSSNTSPSMNGRIIFKEVTLDFLRTLCGVTQLAS